eukprot:TRINITY_DN2456_c0_g1_i2.p1 TRINITY_DN2456_c0_g1~~TRINITY_DN2456_c0_g1_i2.p1  ORF type:complete len:154 (+),score=3.19 TRINITY_DN2456_c0_g1_i2:55-516(+)
MAYHLKRYSFVFLIVCGFYWTPKSGSWAQFTSDTDTRTDDLTALEEYYLHTTDSPSQFATRAVVACNCTAPSQKCCYFQDKPFCCHPKSLCCGHQCCGAGGRCCRANSYRGTPQCCPSSSICTSSGCVAVNGNSWLHVPLILGSLGVTLLFSG